MRKRGITPKVATILLVALVVVLAAIVILWGTKYIEEMAAKRGALAEKQAECSNLEIEVLSATRMAGEVTIAIKNKRDIDIGKFTFRIIGVETEPAESFEKLKGLEARQYSAEFPEDVVRTVDRIDVIPWLKVARGHYVPCSDQHVEIRVAG